MISIVALIGACSGYQISVNNNPIAQPKELFRAEGFSDESLAECVIQTIRDKDIHAASELTTLVCTHAGIKSLEGIQQFTHLEQLGLNDNDLTSVAILSELRHLVRLELHNNPNLDCQHLEIIKRAMSLDLTLIAPDHCMQ